MALLPENLLIVSLRIPENNPEILDIFKCYFDGIFNITSMCDFAIDSETTSDKLYVYIIDDVLEHIFFKINYDFYEYMQICIVSLQDINTASIEYYNYFYKSLVNSYEVYVSKELKQLGLALED